MSQTVKILLSAGAAASVAATALIAPLAAPAHEGETVVSELQKRIRDSLQEELSRQVGTLDRACSYEIADGSGRFLTAQEGVISC